MSYDTDVTVIWNDTGEVLKRRAGRVRYEKRPSLPPILHEPWAPVADAPDLEDYGL